VGIVPNPPVPEVEALSWHVLGRGPADASRADLATLPLAAAALFGQGKSSQGSIAESLGIDTLSLRGSTTLANNVIAVGKRFSNNLYVIYEQSLGGIANVLKVELNVTRRILLTAEAGATSAAGVVFRWTFD
jgi:translocation and assembly module TamB